MQEGDSMLVTRKEKRTLDQLLKEGGKYDAPYGDQVSYIRSLLDAGKIQEIQRAPSNGRIPPLKIRYYRLREEDDCREYIPEILNRLDIRLDPHWYASHPERYGADREYVLALSDYLKEHRDFSGPVPSMNERAVEIWNYEKFFEEGDANRGGSASGFELLRHLGYPTKEAAAKLLHFRFTAEPFAYAVISRKTPQNLLILENKDPFCGMREHLLREDSGGCILGLPVSTLIYGGGKSKEPAFRDFDLNAEPYMKAPGNVFYYAGDLDYEGIRIYAAFHGNAPDLAIRPCTAVYRAMLKKARGRKLYPSRTGQQPFSGSEADEFFSWFTREEAREIMDILEAGNYIPQEILSISDYRQEDA